MKPHRIILILLLNLIVAAGLFQFSSFPAHADSTTYADAVLGTTGLQGYWHLNEASGTTLVDEFGSLDGSYTATNVS